MPRDGPRGPLARCSDCCKTQLSEQPSSRLKHQLWTFLQNSQRSFEKTPHSVWFRPRPPIHLPLGVPPGSGRSEAHSMPTGVSLSRVSLLHPENGKQRRPSGRNAGSEWRGGGAAPTVREGNWPREDSWGRTPSTAAGSASGK